MSPRAIEVASSEDDKVVIALPNGNHPISLSTLQSLYFGNHDSIVDLSAIPPHPNKQRILVTGGAGFVGSHLVDRLMLMGHEVVVVDNFQTGRMENICHWEGHERFTLLNHDIEDALWLECDQIYHLACPASPPHYQYDSVKTVRTCVVGTMNMLDLAKRCNARLLLTSTSEVYGDPEVHPQTEEYRGCVSTVGVRACYDEGKRCAETLAYCYERQHGVEVRVARIFNTYGPRMDPKDGRVVSNFIMQSLQNLPITIYGSGDQTRSFQFVHDLVSGLIALMESSYSQPVNLGNPEEYTVKQFATLIKTLLESDSEIVHLEATPDDPKQRRPNIDLAAKVLKWSPTFKLRDGLIDTIKYFRSCV